ncbi:cupin domain-containing protein [Tabrizicola sp.]|uniref:cupin domain-containing protein n=1 Tax=Tabrizicola sp. TaxID=2005166 RepID=UPI003F2FE40B
MHNDDRSARIHTASQDPEFPARREAGHRAIMAALDAALGPLGYALKGTTWSRTSDTGKSAVHLQRSRYGWEVCLTLRFLMPDGSAPDTDHWREDGEVGLSRFVEEGDPGTIAYLDAEEQPERLAHVIDILTTRAIPWLEAHHDDPGNVPPPVQNHAIDLVRELGKFTDHWSPKIIAGFNGHDVMLVKVQGEFVWHSHPETDDFFLVLKGRLTIQLRDGDVTLNEGELYVVPKGVEHCPMASEEAHLLLIEPAGTPNTGDPATAAVKTVL